MRTLEMKDIPAPALALPDINGQTALITGGERGIGQGIAATLGRLGMNIIVIGQSDEEARVMQQRFEEEAISVTWISADLSVAREVDRAMGEAFDRHPAIELLVNNAVRNRLIDFLEYEEDTWTELFEGNMAMVYRTSLEWARRMKSRGGNIINISSVGGLRAHRRSAAYDATKGAVDSLTRALALDLADCGIRVNAVAPGAIVNRPIDPDNEDRRQSRASGIPLARLGSVTDVGNVVAFLASPAAAYITGQVLYVDGGLTAQLTPPGIYI